MERLLKYLLVILLLLGYGWVGWTYVFTNPSYEAPDEIAHFRYALHLRSTGTLPLQRIGEMGEAHQPPLYYALVAAVLAPIDVQNPIGAFHLNPRFMWAGQGGDDRNAARHGTAETSPYEGQALGLRVARLVSLGLNAITLLAIIAFGWTLFPNTPLIGILAAGMTAFNPQFLFISASVNNDNLLILATTLTVLQLLFAVREPQNRWHWWWVGLWVAIAILTKVSGIVALALAMVWLLIIGVQQRSWRYVLQGGIAMSIVVVAVTGWWFVRNQWLYGDIFGWELYKEIFAANLRSQPLTIADIQEFLRVQFRSFWGVFGWMNVTTPDWFYRLAEGFSFLSVGAIGVGIWLHHRSLGRVQGIGLLIALTIFVITEAYMFSVITTCNASCYQGRYLFSAMVGISTIVAAGWIFLLIRMPIAVQTAMVVVFVGGMASLALWTVERVILDSYDIVALSKAEVARLPIIERVGFANGWELISYDLEYQPEVQKTDLHLYWHTTVAPVLDYVVLIRLVNRQGDIIVESEAIAGDEEYAPTLWIPGDVIEDKHSLRFTEPLLSDIYSVEIHVLDPQTRQPYRTSSDHLYLTLPTTIHP
jgi:4-amino-4-deoxy-L-arabinose transferase-like glycosyltransferase